MRAGGVAVLLVLGAAVACSGRSRFVAPSIDAAGSAGAPDGDGSAGSGGKTSACTCEPPVACEPNFYREPESTSCCESGDCVLHCIGVDCVEPDCQPGMQLRTVAGHCCPLCVRKKPPPCEEAKRLYEEFKAETFAKYGSVSCASRGCAIAGEHNRCLATCGYPVPLVARDTIEEELATFAEETCLACPPVEEPVCHPAPPLACNVSECAFASPNE